VPYQPQRFIHAANVRLDVPVSVYLSEQLTDELRHQLEDATLLSFDCVIENCIEHQVDYLMLSGNLFVEADRSLRARLALLRSFRRLQGKNIPVFVLPGDTDPPEAWRAIPELPDNVHVCFSSSPEPFALERGERTITTVSASMWYGETDAFGIRVIHSSPDGIEPFRIGTVSRAKYDESQRMASLTAAAEDNLINLDSEVDSDVPDAVAPPHPTDPEESLSDYEAGFHSYTQKLMREGRLNYLALGSELSRTEILLETGIVHCPGTTQPRSQLEADCGLCSLISVDAAGNVTSQEINTSAVDWKNITLRLAPGMELNHLLEKMRAILLETGCSPSDRIWSVCWTLTGPLPVLQNFAEDDLELAVTVELDALNVQGRPIRLLHQVRQLPDAWDLEDDQHLAQQYAGLIPQESESRRSERLAFLKDAQLSEGWSKRLESLADGIDPQRLLAQLRTDGADWFVSDFDELMPPPAEELIDDSSENEAGDADAIDEDSVAVETTSSSIVLKADDDSEDDSIEPASTS
jgi:exonuclease SbcD